MNARYYVSDRWVHDSMGGPSFEFPLRLVARIAARVLNRAVFVPLGLRGQSRWDTVCEPNPDGTGSTGEAGP